MHQFKSLNKAHAHFSFTLSNKDTIYTFMAKRGQVYLHFHENSYSLFGPAAQASGTDDNSSNKLISYTSRVHSIVFSFKPITLFLEKEKKSSKLQNSKPWYLLKEYSCQTTSKFLCIFFHLHFRHCRKP